MTLLLLQTVNVQLSPLLFQFNLSQSWQFVSLLSARSPNVLSFLHCSSPFLPPNYRSFEAFKLFQSGNIDGKFRLFRQCCCLFCWHFASLLMLIDQVIYCDTNALLICELGKGNISIEAAAAVLRLLLHFAHWSWQVNDKLRRFFRSTI